MAEVRSSLTHWGWVTHICFSKQTIIGSDNGLSPGRRQAIIRTNAGILLIWTMGTNFSEILSEIHTFSFKKMLLKMSSAKWWQFCLSLNVLNAHSSKYAIWHINFGHDCFSLYLVLLSSESYLNQWFLITSEIYFFKMVIILSTTETHSGSCLNTNMLSFQDRDSHYVQMRGPHNHLIFIMGNPYSCKGGLWNGALALWVPARDPFYTHGLMLIPAWISNHMPNKVWHEITYPLEQVISSHTL